MNSNNHNYQRNKKYKNKKKMMINKIFNKKI